MFDFSSFIKFLFYLIIVFNSSFLPFYCTALWGIGGYRAIQVSIIIIIIIVLINSRANITEF